MKLSFTPLKRRCGYLLFLFLFLIDNRSHGQKLLDEKRVVFLAETPVMLGLIRDSLQQRFTPTYYDVDSSDTILNEHLQTTKQKDVSSPQLSNYYRQYVGFWMNGRKYIYINASCQKPEYFLKNTFYPKGGGSCYFQTFVDLNRQQVEKFYFNAPK